MIRNMIHITLLLSACALALSSCLPDDEGAEAKEHGIDWTGKESELNGVWSGTLAGFMNFKIRLDEGEVIESWLSAAGQSFHTYEEHSNIGYYSFDGKRFEAVLWDDIKSLKGELNNGTLTGKDADGDKFVLSR